MKPEVKTYRYFVRETPVREGAWSSWAIVILCSDGFFSTISDYCNYAYGWWNHSLGDFREFVRDLARKGEYSYFMDKMGERSHLNVERTVARRCGHVRSFLQR